MLRDDFLEKQLRQLLEQLAQAVGRLDAGELSAAAEQAEAVVEAVTSPAGAQWRRLTTSSLLSLINDVERARALARAEWILSVTHEAAGDIPLAKTSNRRAMELYARLKVTPQRLDARAARELAGASFRFRKRDDRFD